MLRNYEQVKQYVPLAQYFRHEWSSTCKDVIRSNKCVYDENDDEDVSKSLCQAISPTAAEIHAGIHDEAWKPFQKKKKKKSVQEIVVILHIGVQIKKIWTNLNWN